MNKRVSEINQRDNQDINQRNEKSKNQKRNQQEKERWFQREANKRVSEINQRDNRDDNQRNNRKDQNSKTQRKHIILCLNSTKQRCTSTINQKFNENSNLLFTNLLQFNYSHFFSFFVLLFVNISLIFLMFSICLISFFFSNILKSLSDHSYSTLFFSFDLAISLQNSHLEQISKINSTSYSYTYILSLLSSIFILSLHLHFLFINCITSMT